MSEIRRNTLTPFGKSDKKSNKSQKSFRLCFTLSDPNENSCPVFDYAATVKSEEKKLLKKHQEEKDRKPNGFVDPFEDNDEDVRRLAREFEAKYGDKKKLKSYADLGAGYDETDPFIDNTDANDETLREDQETAWGGYYINSGPLELKRVEVSDHSDAEEIKKRGRKRSLPVIDEDEEDDDEEDEEKEEDGEGEEDDEEVGEEEVKEDGESKSVVEEESPEPKKTKSLEERIEPEKQPTPSYNGMDDSHLVKKKKKRAIEDDQADSSLAKTKKAKTVKALLEEKRIQEQPPRISEEPKRQMASETSIVEAIESVVNAGNHQDENSNSSNSLHSGGTVSSSVSEDSHDGKPDLPPPLPDNLSPEVTALVSQIKQTAAVTDNTRKTFCTDINNSFIKLEWKVRELSTAGRNMLFAHLAHHLPCTKETLMRRGKKLFIHKEESHMETIICKLKATIDATMPTLLEEYGKECQRIAEDKGLSAGEGNTPGEENQQASRPPAAILPKRKFPWTDETRGYLLSIVRCKQKCYKISKTRKNTWENYIQSFLHSRVRPLWPSGWMKTSVLIKEINRSPTSSKHKHSSHSHHSPSKAESSRLNMAVSISSSVSSNGSLYVSPSGETTKCTSAATNPLAARVGADSINLSSNISPPYNPSPSQPKKPNSSSHHHVVKTEKPETFSVDHLLKRTSEGVSSQDYNTTLSDLMKKEGVIINGASLPLKNVNSNQKSDSNRSEKILDLSSCNSSVNVSVKPSVIQNTASSDRTTALNSDGGSVRVNSMEKLRTYTTSPSVKENKSEKPASREVDKETTTATDILSQIISESLRSPPQPPYNTTATKPKEDIQSHGVHKDQELLYDVMQDLKELNHLSSGGGRDSKNTSFTGASWSYPVKPVDNVKSTPYHNEFLNYISGNATKDAPVASSTPNPQPYSRHNTSSYENSGYVNEVNKSMYSHSTHRTSQSLTAHTSSISSSKVNQMSQMKNSQNTGISTGLPHRYMDYTSEDPHLMGLASSLQYSLTNWPYTGSESQPHQ